MQVDINKQQGFTLIEIIIALVIFSILGTVAFTGLNEILKRQAHLEARSKQVTNLQLALKYLERDINQSISRRIRDQFGDTQPAFSSDGETIMSFTHSGWRNPAGLSRSVLQRVAYELSEKKLIRHSWNRLDGAIIEDAREITLLEDVEDFELGFLSNNSTWVDQWPPINTNPNNSAGLPRAILFTFTVAPFGEISRIFTVPQ